MNIEKNNDEDQKISVHVSLEFKKIWQLRFSRKIKKAGQRETQGLVFEKAFLYYMQHEEPRAWEEIQQTLNIEDDSVPLITKREKLQGRFEEEPFDDEFEQQKMEIKKLLVKSDQDSTSMHT
jgi:hypothetical protein